MFRMFGSGGSFLSGWTAVAQLSFVVVVHQTSDSRRLIN